MALIFGAPETVPAGNPANNDLNLEIKTSISQVKEIAKLRLTELINE